MEGQMTKMMLECRDKVTYLCAKNTSTPNGHRASLWSSAKKFGTAYCCAVPTSLDDFENTCLQLHPIVPTARNNSTCKTAKLVIICWFSSTVKEVSSTWEYMRSSRLLLAWTTVPVSCSVTLAKRASNSSILCKMPTAKMGTSAAFKAFCPKELLSFRQQPHEAATFLLFYSDYM